MDIPPQQVFPACAGVILFVVDFLYDTLRLSRMRGGDPKPKRKTAEEPLSFPHARG